MAAKTGTYTLINSNTLSSTATSITFSSIPATYTDLVLVTSVLSNAANGEGLEVQFNSDTATNYSKTYLYGDGASVVSGRTSGSTSIAIGNIPTQNSDYATTIAHINDYANTTTYKSTLSKSGSAATGNLSIMYVGLWRSTTAINAIKVFHKSGGSMSVGCTFKLYGIEAAK
jgi:hypothetical protein